MIKRLQSEFPIVAVVALSDSGLPKVEQIAQAKFVLEDELTKKFNPNWVA